ncbi:MAG: shikimate kinase [Planctomycetota bacterium]
MNLFLIGFRGSGKTTVARVLAKRLGRDLVDTDAWIAERAGKSIAEIFEVEGEAGFRLLEAQVIAAVCLESDRVVSLGGGAILNDANRSHFKASGWTVWLDARPETLAHRIATDIEAQGQRPALTDHPLIDEVRAVTSERRPLYEAVADHHVLTDSLEPDAIADNIIAHFPRESVA